MLTDRLRKALKREAGLRLSPADVQRLSLMLGLSFPEKRGRGKKDRHRHKYPPTRPAVNVAVRWLIRRDMDEVVEIEAASVSDPWSEDEFLKHLRGRNCIGMVMTIGERVAGFVIYELHQSMLQVLRMAVDPRERCQSIGRQGVARLIAKLSDQRRNAIAVDVPETNMDMLMFLKRMGFKAAGMTRYRSGPEDVLMRYSVAKSSPEFRIIDNTPPVVEESAKSDDDDGDGVMEFQ